MVRFLSHDLRSPHVAISSLAERLIEQQAPAGAGGHRPGTPAMRCQSPAVSSTARAELRPLRADPPICRPGPVGRSGMDV
jgi:hypothetical protein